MLRPFPQYSGVSDVAGNVSNSNYQSLELTAKDRSYHGLALTFNYVLQREYDDKFDAAGLTDTATDKSRFVI